MEEDNDDDISSFREKSPYSPDLHLKTANKPYERDMFINGILEANVPIHYPVKLSVEAYKRYTLKPVWILRKDSETTYGTLLTPELMIIKGATKESTQFNQNFRLSTLLTITSLECIYKDLGIHSKSVQKIISSIKTLKETARRL